jgi:hypothetical protein
MSSGLLRHLVSWKFTDVSVVFAASIIREMMEAASTSETSVNFHQTIQRSNQEGKHLRTLRRENLIYGRSNVCECSSLEKNNVNTTVKT